MLRRVQSAIAPRTTQRRSYFYSNVGESGIWGQTWKMYYRNLNICIVLGVTFGIYVLKGPYAGDKQFAPFASDLFLSDGTELEGDEAAANARIELARMQPFMDELRMKAGVDE